VDNQLTRNEGTVGTGSQYQNRLLVLVSAPLLSKSDDSETGFDPVPLLGVWDEALTVFNSLRAAKCNNSILVDIAVATHQRVLEALSEASPPLVIHFSGHGEPRGIGVALVVEDQYGVAADLTAQDLGNYIRALGRVPCAIAVLNACYSERLAETLIEAGVNHVIAVNANQAVLDDACRQFSAVFYPRLFKLKNVRTAFLAAQTAVKAHFESKRHGPGDPAGAIFESLKGLCAGR
jgi:hypothetical protein